MNRAQVLAEIEKAKQATPGPCEPQGNIVRRVYRDEQNRRCTSFPAQCNATTEPNHENAAFIAAAFTNYLAVLQQLDQAMGYALDSNRHTSSCICSKCEQIRAYFAKD